MLITKENLKNKTLSELTDMVQETAQAIVYCLYEKKSKLQAKTYAKNLELLTNEVNNYLQTKDI